MCIDILVEQQSRSFQIQDKYVQNAWRERNGAQNTCTHGFLNFIREKVHVMKNSSWQNNLLPFSHMRIQTNIRFGPYFVEPIVAGLGKDNKPFICAMDLIGCINFAKDFVVSGTAGSNLYGMCESLWEPDLEPEDLFETISQALLNAQDRDALSGWGAVVHVM